MKIAIITNNEDHWEKPTAEGLHRMLKKINIESKVYYDGYQTFMGFRKMNFLNLKSFIKSIRFNLKIILKLSKIFLNSYDTIILVSCTPRAFFRHFYVNIEFTRKFFKNKPIILYDPHYLPTRGKWYKYIKEGKPDEPWMGSNGYGVERYDYYLVISVVSEYPLAKIKHPISEIGLNLEDGSLYPEKKEKFLALIDFEQITNMYERAIMIQALEETKTEYIVLHNKYTIEEIRAIYRKCSIFILASRETFGFPICELQACGAYIFTPFSNWVPSHWIKDPYKSGDGHLSSNFIVYDNDINKLKKEIIRIKNNYDPYEVFNTFLEYYPQFYYGNLDELSKLISKIESKEITGNSHLKYFEINNSIVDNINISNNFFFCWDESPGNDSLRLIDFLEQNYNINWNETGKIEKIDNCKTIRVSTEKRNILLKLNNEKTKLNIEIDGVRADEFSTKIENNKLNIYSNLMTHSRKIYINSSMTCAEKTEHSSIGRRFSVLSHIKRKFHQRFLETGKREIGSSYSANKENSPFLCPNKIKNENEDEAKEELRSHNRKMPEEIQLTSG